MCSYIDVFNLYSCGLRHSFYSVDGGLEGMVKFEGRVEVFEGVSLVARQFVGAPSIHPSFCKGAVALYGSGEVIDSLWVVAIGEQLDIASVMPSIRMVGVDVEDLFVQFLRLVHLVEVLVVHCQGV